MTWCIPSNFYTLRWVGPHKSVSSRTPHLLTPALVVSNTTAHKCRWH